MVRKVSSVPSVAPLLIVALVAVVAVSGMFVMGGSSSSLGVASLVGGGVTGAQVAEAEGCNYERYSSMSQWAEDKMSEGWALNYGWSCPSGDEIPEVPGQVFECTETSFGDCGWIRAARYVECESDHEEVSTTGHALALSGKGRANWFILGAALLAVVLLGVLLKSGPATSKRAKKHRALLLAGIFVLAVVAGGLVLLKPVTRGQADELDKSCPKQKVCWEEGSETAGASFQIQCDSPPKCSGGGMKVNCFQTFDARPGLYTVQITSKEEHCLGLFCSEADAGDTATITVKCRKGGVEETYTVDVSVSAKSGSKDDSLTGVFCPQESTIWDAKEDAQKAFWDFSRDGIK